MSILRRIFNLCENTVYWVTGLVLLTFALFSILVQTLMPQETAEKMQYSLPHYGRYLWLFLLVGIIWAGRKKLATLNSKKIFLIGEIGYFCLGIFLIFSAPARIRADADYVLKSAQQLNQNNYSALLTGGYLEQYPHQLGLVSWERFWLLFTANPKFFFFLNLLAVLIANWALWQIAENLYGKKRLAINLTLVGIFAFLPPLFFILFLYGTTISLSALTVSLWALTRLGQQYCTRGRYWPWALLCWGALFFAYSWRTNCLIAVIAVVVIGLVRLVETKQKKLVLLLVALLLVVPVSSSINKYFYQAESGHKISAGIPKTAWLVMGLQESGREAGWFNAYNIRVFKKHGGNPQATAKQVEKDLQQRLDYLGQHPVYAGKFFARKAISTWTEPTYQSVWSGPLKATGQETNNPLARSIYQGGKLYYLLYDYLSALMILIYFGAGIFPWLSRQYLSVRQSTLLGFSYLYFFGGLLFHLGWETKSQYVVGYVFLLLPAAALAGAEILTGHSAEKQQIEN